MATVPGTLAATNLDPASTATTSGSVIVFAPGQVARWTATPTAPGDHWLRFDVDAPFGARFIVKVDGLQQYTQTLFDASEEEEIVPAHTAVESTITVPLSGLAAVQADPTKPANRYRVRIINTHASVRVFVARSQADAEAASAEQIEADSGRWEDNLDGNVSIWVRSVDAAIAPTIRVIQYTTA